MRRSPQTDCFFDFDGFAIVFSALSGAVLAKPEPEEIPN